MVYLCGGINGLSDSACKDWREVAKSLLEMPTLDPMRRDYRGREDDCVDEIVDGDIEDIRISKYVLVNATKPSWGTAMEVRIAKAERGLKVASFVGDAVVSPWLRKHSTFIAKTVEEACAEVNSWGNTLAVLGAVGDELHSPHPMGIKHGCPYDYDDPETNRILQEERGNPMPVTGTFACPICGVTHPHEHTGAEIAEWRAALATPAPEQQSAEKAGE